MFYELTRPKGVTYLDESDKPMMHWWKFPFNLDNYNTVDPTCSLGVEPKTAQKKGFSCHYYFFF